MNSVTITPKFTRGDVVTLKAMADSPECGKPQRFVVAFWRVNGGYDEEGWAIVSSVVYYCRIVHDAPQTWSTKDATQGLSTGPRLDTGEVPIHEFELELYIPPTTEEK